MEIRSIEAVSTALQKAGVRYLVVGGVAVNAHGYMRMTRDLDLVVQLVPENIRAAMAALAQLGYRPMVPVSLEDLENSRIRQSWAEEKNMIVLKLWSDDHPRTPMDLFIQEPFDYERESEAAITFQITQEIGLPIISRECLIRMKKDLGRPQDLADVAELEKLP
jgi:hypothetical protein